MNGSIASIIILGYFGILILISYFTSRGGSDSSFFTGDKKSPWYLVAFGMIGATLSGITFISVPGSVYEKGMSYMPMVFGFLFGYLAIAFVLIPLYYRLNLTSIYTYLKDRFGYSSFKTGASFFLLSRTVGASLRLYLVAEVLDIFLFSQIGLPYWLGIVLTIALIWVYTFKSGIKTIVWTDTLQTASLLIAMGATIYFLKTEMDASLVGLWDTVSSSELFSFKGGMNGKEVNIGLSVFNGALMALVMTGLDQDMMQKNLTCENASQSRKNMIWFVVIFIPINLLFLSLGVLLYENYLGSGDLQVLATEEGFKYLLNNPNTGEVETITNDRLYPSIANFGYFPIWLSAVFLVGLVAAAYSSADSALTSLTTSFCLDILEKDDKKTRLKVHIGMSVLLILVIMVFKGVGEDGIIWKLYKYAGFTYGPLLGLFGFGILTRYKVKDVFVPGICIVSAFSSFFIQKWTGMGVEVLLVNGLITAMGLYIFRNGKMEDKRGLKESGILDSNT